MGNSHVSSSDEIKILASNVDAMMVDTKGKLYIYDVLGFECKAFSLITKSLFYIYMEYSGGVDCYIREY